MKALSIKQPWANMIAEGKKTIETRKWSTNYRGPLLIVSTKSPPIKPAGFALAVAQVIDCRAMTESDEPAACCPVYAGAFSWVLQDVQKVEPFPVKGSIGLYEVTVTAEQTKPWIVKQFEPLQTVLEETPAAGRQSELVETLCDAIRAHDMVAFSAALAIVTELNACDSIGFTPLAGAAADGYLEMVEILLEKGADVNATASENLTPLHWSTYRDDSISRVLIARGADVNARDIDGRTPLHLAVGRKTIANCRLLIANGCDVDAKDNHGESPLHYAAKWGTADIAKLLIASGATIMATDNYDSTPLHGSSACRRVEISTILVDSGARRDARDTDGLTPLDYEKACEDDQRWTELYRRYWPRYEFPVRS